MEQLFTVANKGHHTYKLYIPHLNFMFLIQTLCFSYKLYKLYVPRTSIMFLIPNLCSSLGTNFILHIQTLSLHSLYKLYIPRTNLMFLE